MRHRSPLRIPLRGDAARQGQALLELIASILTVVLTVASSGWLMKIEWDRGRCAYIVFENTHAQVANSPPPDTPPWFSSRISIHDLPDAVEGSSHCGESEESVTLPKLEPAEENAP